MQLVMIQSQSHAADYAAGVGPVADQWVPEDKAHTSVD